MPDQPIVAREPLTVAAPAWPIRFLPSLMDVVTLFPILFVMLRMQGVSTLLGDGDTGWHIRTGEWILQHGQVPHFDIFSFSKSGQPWFAWEWGWDVCFAWIHQQGGLPAVVFLNLVLLGAISALLLRLVRHSAGNDLVAALVTLAAVAGTSIHWLARPHLVSWLFVVIFCHILNRVSEGQTQLLFWLPFLILLWTNLHGGFFIGIALVLAYAVDPLIAAARRKDRRARTIPYFVCAIACVLASFVNPYSWALHQHVLAYLFDSKQVENILEFQSINFHHPLARYFEIFLGLGAIATFENVRRGRFTEAIVFIAWAHLALLSIRNIPIFLLFAAPSVARALADWLCLLRRWIEVSGRFQALEAVPRFHVLSFASFLLLLILMAKPGEARLLRSEYDPAKYPANAIEKLQTSKATSIFTDDEWGDYVIYRLYPTGHVFIDGRSDFYGADFESQYLGLMNVRYDWERQLSAYRVDTVLLRVEAPLAGALKLSPHWRVSYDDGIALIFVRNNALRGDVPAVSLIAATRFSPAKPDSGKGR